MEKKKTAVPAFLGVAAVWIGSHFGPGFATGAFSVRWYVKYGWVGLVTPLLAMFVTGGVMYYMLEYAREHGTPGYRPFARSCYGEKLGGVVAVLYDVCFLMTMMCAGGLAFSGEGKLLQGFLGINYWTTAIVTILVSAALCLYGSKLLAKSSGYMMYAIVGVVLLITVLALARGDCDVTGAFANSAANAKDSSFLHAILGAMQYGCFQSTIVFNVMSVSDVLKDKKEARKAILSGYVITIVLMVCLIFTLFSYTNVFDVCAEALPVMAVLNRLGMKWLQWLYVILMTLAVLALARGDCDVTGAFANSAANAKDSSFLHAILGAMQYGCFQSTIVFNVMSVSDVLKDKKEARKAILSGYVITIVLMVCLIFTLFSYTNVFDVCAEALPVMAVLNRLGMKWLQWLYVILMTLAVLTSAAGLAHAGNVRFDGLFQFIPNKQLRRFVITAILLGIAAVGAALGFQTMLQQGTSIVGWTAIPVIVIPVFTFVAAKVRRGA